MVLLILLRGIAVYAGGTQVVGWWCLICIVYERPNWWSDATPTKMAQTIHVLGDFVQNVPGKIGYVSGVFGEDLLNLTKSSCTVFLFRSCIWEN